MMSELRNTIKMHLLTTVYDVTEHTRLHHSEINPDTAWIDKRADAILDAVIAALPEPTPNEAPYFKGVKAYHDIVIDLLQAAKESK
jgi:hypothetical protein